MMLKIILAQLNFTVGDIAGNAQQIQQAMGTAKAQQADIIIFPELALSGYPPEDLLLRQDFLSAIAETLHQLKISMPKNLIAVIGYPEKAESKIYNSAIVMQRDHILANHRKNLLPNYGVFDEKRYFTTGDTVTLFTTKNITLGVTICEDLWHPGVALANKQAGAELLISLNASPFYLNKQEKRLSTLRQRITETNLPIIYAHHCGAQDDLIFDGQSFVLDAQGKLVAQAPFGETLLMPVEYDSDTQQWASAWHENPLIEMAQLYKALVCGVRDYVRKNGFSQVLLGFSGGIDSALTLAIAVDALGTENVLPVILPSRYTSTLSMDLIYQQLQYLKMGGKAISIEPSFEAFLKMLGEDTNNPPLNLMTQNLQARCRGVVLMALANAQQALLLNTSNKSEIATGYGTLYGDMCGAYGVLKDVWKTQIFQLAHYRNELNRVIPEEIITRPPSAELVPDQRDTDQLLPYEILDVILQKYIEQDCSIEEIVAAGFAESDVKRVIRLVTLNEYKRKQAPLGPRVSTRAFTRERRYPISTPFPFSL